VIFKSFYRKIRVLIAVRDFEKIPPNKLFEMEQCFFCVTFEVEKPAVDGITIDEDDDNNGDDDQQEGNEDAAEENDEEEELGDNGGARGVTGMDTEMITPKAKKVGHMVMLRKPMWQALVRNQLFVHRKNKGWNRAWARKRRTVWRWLVTQKKGRHML
jgi:hypothetical protein